MTSVSLPRSPAATKTPSSKVEDKIFGSKFTINSHHGELLVDSTELIIDTPIKIGVHKSCSERIMNHLLPHFPMDLSPTEGIAFDPKSVSNLPPYADVIEAIIKHSSVQIPGGTRRTHIIHVGNVGTRISELSTVLDMFRCIHETRSWGVKIDVTQIDIAFSIPSSANTNLVQWSCECGGNGITRDILMKQVKREVWSLHDVYTDENNSVPENIQRGTVRLKQVNRTTPSGSPLVPVIGFGSSFPLPPNDIETLSSIYVIEQGSSDNHDEEPSHSLAVDGTSLFSIKAYSNVAHHTTRDKANIPLQKPQSDALISHQFGHLQRILHKLAEKGANVLQFVNQHGVSGRLEISVRPTDTNPNDKLRTSGNLIDFMVHVYLGVFMSFNGKYKLCLHNDLNIESVSFRLHQIILHVQEYIQFRAQRQFKDVFKSPSTHAWLKAMFYLITTLLGLTHHGKNKYLLDWLKGRTSDPDHSIFDPFHLKRLFDNESLCHAVVLVDENIDSATESLENHWLEQQSKIESNLRQHLLFLGMSQGGVDVIKNGCRSDRPIRTFYEMLPLDDKLCLATHFDDAISNIAHTALEPPLDNNTEDNNLEGNSSSIYDDLTSQSIHESLMDEDGNYISVIPTSFYRYIDPDQDGGSHISTLLCLLNQNQPQQLNGTFPANKTSPAMKYIYRLSEFSQFHDSSNPLFFRWLKRYLILFYEDLYPNTDKLSSIKQFLERMHKPSYNDTVCLCMLVGLKLSHTTVKSTQHFLSLICAHTWFPTNIPGTSYEKDIPHDKILLNDMLKKVHREISTISIPSRNLNTRRYYRADDRTHINVPRLETVLDEIQGNPGEPSYPTNEVYEIIDVAFNPHIENDGCGQVQRELIHGFCSKLHPISDYFLKDDATNNPSFDDIYSIDELHDIECPTIAFPLCCCAHQKDIIVFNLSDEKTAYHLYDSVSQKVVTYCLDGVSWTPKRVCTMFAYEEADDEGGCASLYVHTSINNHIERTPLNGPNVLMFNPSLYQKVRNIRHHPLGKMTYKRNKDICDCIFSLMTSPTIEHQRFVQQKQHLKPFIDSYLGVLFCIRELSHSNVPMGEIFDPSLISHLNQLNITRYEDILDLFNSVSSLQQRLQIEVLLIFVSFAYKLWFCLWTRQQNRCQSIYIWSDPYTQKIHHIIIPGYTYQKFHKQILYINANFKDNNLLHSMGYWVPPNQHNPFKLRLPNNLQYNCHSVLTTKYGYLGLDLLNTLMSVMKTRLNIDIVTNISSPRQLISDPRHTRFLPQTISESDSCLAQHTLMVAFFMNNTAQTSDVFYFHNNLLDEQFLPSLNKGVEALFSSRVDKEFNLTICNVDDVFSQVTYSSGFMILLIICLGHHAENGNNFLDMIDRCLNVIDIVALTKRWVMHCAMNSSYFDEINYPMWLKQIIKINLV